VQYLNIVLRFSEKYKFFSVAAAVSVASAAKVRTTIRLKVFLAKRNRQKTTGTEKYRQCRARTAGNSAAT
jgi:hypothetical protein